MLPRFSIKSETNSSCFLENLEKVSPRILSYELLNENKILVLVSVLLTHDGIVLELSLAVLPHILYVSS